MARTGSTADAVVIILAAGLGRRMGGVSKKDLAWEDGSTLLDYAVRLINEAGMASLAVIHDPQPGTGMVFNPHPEHGLSSSLQVGLDAVRERFGPVPVGVLLVDQPFVTVSDLRKVYDHFQDRSDVIHAIRPRYDGIPGHPVFFDAGWDDVVWKLDGDQGLGGALLSRPDVAWIDLAVSFRPNPSFDVDTLNRYEEALVLLKGEKINGS